MPHWTESDRTALAWLLDSANPSVRYLTLRRLLHGAESDPEVLAARRAIMAAGPAAQILADQGPDGAWDGVVDGYSPMYGGTVWQMVFLAELCADPADPRVRSGCERVLSALRAADGSFPATGKIYKKHDAADMLCCDGQVAFALLRLGMGQDPRVQRAAESVARSLTDGRGRCHYNAGLPCAWGVVKGLRALAEIPDSERTQTVRDALYTGIEFVLGGDLSTGAYPTKPNGKPSRQWAQFGFPRSYQTDALEAMETLVLLGAARDSRLEPTLELIRKKRRPDGAWRLDFTLNRMRVPLETLRQPSRWITLRALTSLHAAGVDSR